MASAHARRIVLAPSEEIPSDRAEAAAVAIAERMPDGVLRLGSLVPAGPEKLVVVALDPATASRVGADTEVRFDVTPIPAATADVWDVAVLVDHGAAMRSRLGAARGCVEALLSNGSDVVRNVALLGFAAEPFKIQPLASFAKARPTHLDGLVARGRSRIVPALDAGFAELLRGKPGPRRALVVLTDGSDAKAGPDAGTLADAGRRAQRLGIRLFALDLGAAPFPGLADATSAGGGIAVRGPSMRPVVETLAREAGVPLEWREPPAPGEEVEFEIVVRAIPPDPPDFPKIPRKRKK